MISIREFATRDADHVSQMIIETLRRVNVKDYPAEAIEALVPYYATEKLIEKSRNHHMIVAVRGSGIVGTASIDGNRVRNVFVDSGMHRKGIGRRLMNEIEAQARSDGQSSLQLYAALSAQGFYQKLGYTPVEHLERDLGGISIAEVRMEKDL